ncbi:hypothetical protein L1987_13285 [Smallanthus sonchifolius]|uniref:Uncharacterized protein n=1 Tax=Smallanthus sonchifolius TaxID=185202 RepID=A0ACB9JGI8_9ASTR|nr:hypothetical protein L1987_13285 [Smallanthus sonchifolius]
MLRYKTLRLLLSDMLKHILKVENLIKLFISQIQNKTNLMMIVMIIMILLGKRSRESLRKKHLPFLFLLNKDYEPVDELENAKLKARQARAEVGRKNPRTKKFIILQTLSTISSSTTATTTSVFRSFIGTSNHLFIDDLWIWLDLEIIVLDLSCILDLQVSITAATDLLQAICVEAKTDMTTMPTRDDEDKDLYTTTCGEHQVSGATPNVTFQGECSGQREPDSGVSGSDDWFSDEEVKENKVEIDSEDNKYKTSEGVEFSYRITDEISQLD